MSDDLLEFSPPIRVSGHETFPLRLLWLKKAFDAVSVDGGVDRRTFHEPSAIGRFGVGKNMALSMRHWGLALQVIAEHGELLVPTPLGRLVFSDDGLDPYLEHHSTLWLIHAQLVSTADAAATFFYAFNKLNHTSFVRDDLVQSMSLIVSARGGRATNETLKRDVEVFVRSYAARQAQYGEDASEPLFVELGLLRESRIGGQLEFVRGPQNSLDDSIFALVLKRFWKRNHPSSPTLSVEQLQYGAGSPGRVFKLDEDSLVIRLMRIADATDGAIAWTDTAGLRQVALVRNLDELHDQQLIVSAYGKGRL